jgi:hypothetical protein
VIGSISLCGLTGSPLHASFVPSHHVLGASLPEGEQHVPSAL